MMRGTFLGLMSGSVPFLRRAVMLMYIESFNLTDIDEAARLTYDVWGDELCNESIKFRHFVYEAMVRYYCRDVEYSFKLVDDASRMQAFLLSAKTSEHNHSGEWFLRQAYKFSQRERQLAQGYLRYLHYNGKQMLRHAGRDDLMLCLFLSKVSGGGKQLLNSVERKARATGINKMLLWADATCDYDYYLRRGFRQAETFTNDVLPVMGKLSTIVYSKELAW